MCNATDRHQTVSGGEARSSDIQGLPTAPAHASISAMDIIDSAIDDYLTRRSAPGDSILEEMERRAVERNFPIVGPQAGRALCLLARLMKATRVLELGSGYGYSAYWFAKAMGPEGEITLTEYSHENMDVARMYLQRGGFRCGFDYRVGDALRILDSVEGEFDIVFNDVDKHLYPQVFLKGARRVKKGGLLITDNVLWSGKVLDSEPDEATRGILEYTRLIYENSDFFSTILPIRDGVSVSLRRG